jgi:hypothetical protein
MKVMGIVGSRRRDTKEDALKVYEAFADIYKKDDMICSGGCPKGADKFAENIAKECLIPIRIFHADWNKYGKSAGFIRNTDIAKLSDILIACVASDRTGGTEDTIKKFKQFHPKGKVILL